MTLYYGPGGPLPHIPDDLSIPQFIFGFHRVPKPRVSAPPAPWFIEEATGRKIYGDEVRLACPYFRYAISLSEPAPRSARAHTRSRTRSARAGR